ncbi:MAG: methyl-accepting chemotaxis protein [Myxococcales bacterium]
MLSKLKIGTKLVGGFLLISLMLAGLGLYVRGEITVLDDLDSDLFEHNTVPLGHLVEMTSGFQRARGQARDIILEQHRKDDVMARHQKTLEGLAKTEKEYERLIVSDEMRQAFAKYQQAREAYFTELEKIMVLGNLGKVEEAKVLLATTLSRSDACRDALAAMVEMKVADAKKKAELNDSTAKGTNRTVLVTTLALVLASLVLGIWLARAITEPLRQMMEAAQALSRGDIDQSIDHRSEDETGKLADSLRDTIDYIQEVAKGAEALAAGDLTVQVKPRSEADVLSKNFAQAIGTVRAMTDETSRLIAAAKDGALSTRGDASKFHGAYAGIVKGVNELLDAVIGPLNVAADYVDKISKGAIPSKITDRYNGDFNAIKDNLNTCIDAVNALISDAGHLSAAAVEGKLATRADASKHHGDFRRIVEGVNQTLDAVIGPLNVAADYVDKISKGAIPSKITDRYNGDFNTIKDNLNTCIDAINALIADAGKLSAAAVDGKLATRADASKHQGDFRRIVEGVNATLDAVIGPLNVAADYVNKISKGAIPSKITDAYNGDFNTLKNNLNTCIDAVNALIADAKMLSQAAVEGRLATRADASKHQGDFRRIVEGVNQTLDAVLGPINLATDVLQRLADQDLRARVTGDFQGDHTKIKNAVNQTASALHDALASVAEAVDQVASASEQIAATSQTVSQGASEQASAIEETSSNMEEMLGITKQNTDNTAQAKALAQTAKASADKGSSAMGRMADAMQSVKKGAEGTAAIIADVSEIAFQTNLLALNAAVEAARAGDAGRGFAVVADEVRSLAQRAKEAAKKTEDLIKESLKLAGDGESISREVATDLNEIVSAVGKVTGIVGEIAASSTEQSRGIDQINKAIGQMDKATQQAAGSAEESSSSAEELSSQAQALAGLVSRFKLERKQSGRALARKPSQQHALPAAKPVGHGFTKGSGNGSAKANGNGHAMNLRPEDVIPLESDPVFKDF